MDLKTSLSGRLRNTKLPYNKGLLPLYEAVVNSIHAIYEKYEGDATKGTIIVRIERDSQSVMDFEKEASGRKEMPHIVNFEIEDDGVGFTDKNWESFQTLDSTYKESKGCRGIGRLLWLKAFEKAQIKSYYKGEDATILQRKAIFSEQKGIEEVADDEGQYSSQTGTVIRLENFISQYRKSASKTVLTIARSLLEHCLWYYISPGRNVPIIKIIDFDGEELFLDEMFDAYMCEQSDCKTIKIKNEDFEITHLKLREAKSLFHNIALCAGSRLVVEEALSKKIPGLFDGICDESGEFTYVMYVTADYLDKRVEQERTGFDIPENNLELIDEISMQDIRDATHKEVKDFLEDVLKNNLKKSAERIETFVHERAPRYKVILNKAKDNIIVSPDASNKEIDLLLHKELSSLENELIEEGHSLMLPQVEETVEGYLSRLSEYRKKANDIKSSDLANYVFHRRVLLDVFESCLSWDEEGKYRKEDVVHNLIMPMGKDSSNIHPDELNLWIIDERLAFHNYIASDMKLSSNVATESTSLREPDISLFSFVDKPLAFGEEERAPYSTVSIVEFKKPMRQTVSTRENDDPVQQCVDYLEKIRESKVKNSGGRAISLTEGAPAYLYAICDMVDGVNGLVKKWSLTPTQRGDGFYGYHKGYDAHIEIITYNGLLNRAIERNKAFFDKLGLPTK